ncbi:hypothetical protein ACFE04_001573 [Oxalis oulophora]
MARFYVALLLIALAIVQTTIARDLPAKNNGLNDQKNFYKYGGVGGYIGVGHGGVVSGIGAVGGIGNGYGGGIVGGVGAIGGVGYVGGAGGGGGYKGDDEGPAGGSGDYIHKGAGHP